jgi:LytR cell envelope-related transcriptional attenuator
MASTAQRRPLPAVLSLVALLLLTARVWWRVLNRSSGDTTHEATKSACPSPSATAGALPAPSAVTVTVLNSTTKKGIAGKARTTLVQDGFKSPSIATNDSRKELGKIKSVAEIRYGPTGKAGATLLHYYLPGSTPVATTSRTAVVVVSLGTAYRGVASTAAVTAALKKAGLAPRSPSAAASC